MLCLENISWKAPEGGQILKNVSLCLEDGRFTAIIGPNGGGKTTVAKIIAGIVKPDSGRITLDGRDITDLDVTERARLGISFAFQQPVHFKGITVRKLLETAAGEKLPESRLCEVLAAVGMCARDYLGRQVDGTLSGGEIKRIEIATVIARDTRVSVFDEPEAGIDLWSFRSLVRAFRDLRASADGIIAVISHQRRILNIADEIILISGGTVKAHGPRGEMLKLAADTGGVAPYCCREEKLFDE